MSVSRLAHIPGIGVDEIGDAADAARNPDLLRLENLDTDVPPPAVAREVTRAAIGDDAANRYLPFQGHRALRVAAAEHVSAMTGHHYDPGRQCVSVAGGLNGILNVQLATVEPGQEVVIGAWVIWDAAMERIVFGDHRPVHPAAHPGLAARTITVGSASKELRMIGWRVGWVLGPGPIMRDIGLVGLTNVVCQVGIAQQAVAAALRDPGSGSDVAAATRLWQRRSEHILEQLAGYPCIRPDGGWSLLIDCASLGLSGTEASRRLFTRGEVAATPMTGWGPGGERYLRLVFANEPIERLADLRARFDAALA
jgi:aspartate/methionine/tyrosine aminotransferase